MFTYDENLFSDLYKDAYGFRPRGHEFFDAETSEARKQELWDLTLNALTVAIDHQAELEAAAVAAFEARIAQMGELGASDIETAIRWILEAEDMSEFDLMYGAEKVCFDFGLPYSFGLNIIINRVCKEMLDQREAA